MLWIYWLLLTINIVCKAAAVRRLYSLLAGVCIDLTQVCFECARIEAIATAERRGTLRFASFDCSSFLAPLRVKSATRHTAIPYFQNALYPRKRQATTLPDDSAIPNPESDPGEA